MKSFKEYRHRSNPKEKEFHDKFLQDHSKGVDMSLIVFGHVGNGTRPLGYLTPREEDIVLSTIQWLGSPVGQGFLNSCGFKEEKILV